MKAGSKTAMLMVDQLNKDMAIGEKYLRQFQLELDANEQGKDNGYSNDFLTRKITKITVQQSMRRSFISRLIQNFDV